MHTYLASLPVLKVEGAHESRQNLGLHIHNKSHIITHNSAQFKPILILSH
jgi:hypothetical protein